MAQNISDNFTNLCGGRGTLADYFIDRVSVQLLGCGITETAPERVNSFLLPYFLAVSYKKGSVEIQHGDEITLLKPGSFFIFRPHDVYSGKRIGEEPLTFAYLQFDIEPFMERYNLGVIAAVLSDAVFQKPCFRPLGELLGQLAGDDPARHGRTALLGQLAKMILGQIIYDQAVQSSDYALLKKGRNSKIINHAFRYTAEHLSAPISIGAILRDGKTSKTSLERAFHDVLGTTPQRALLRFKIERSMEMLLQNTSLKDIVKALGFSSVFHYSNAFQKITGLRPTEYRRGIENGRRLL